MIPMKTLTLDGKTYEIVDEYARRALGDHAGPTDEQIREAIDTWLDENGDSIIPDVSGGNGKSAYEYAKDAGYTGTEEEFAQKLAEEALIAVTDDITPAQVAEAVSNGRNVILTHIDGTYGPLCFNNFIYVPALASIISSSIVFFAGDYLVVELVGNTRDGSWAALSKEVATVDDIPVPVIGTTADVTPSQVKELMDAGKPFAITHTDNFYGSMLFNSFVSAIGGILSTTVFQLSGVTYCAQLIADLTENQWIFNAFTLATTADIPESLKNPYALTINGTSYDGSKAVDLTEAVNNMIVAKLNALTHAEEVAF